jgi:hypothetical protein
MKITLFTSNQPRHIALIDALSGIASEMCVVQECNTLFPGRVAGSFQASDVMAAYFERVTVAERAIFGPPMFSSEGARILALRMGDLNLLELDVLAPALKADVYIVFGASYIRGALCDFLVKHRAYNIHMGVSPYYRGSSTNFWPLFDGRPEFVGATIHLLTQGLDSGPILFHALPGVEAVDPFRLGMKAVRIAHEAFLRFLSDGTLAKFEPVVQDKRLEIRYTRGVDFTNAVAQEYLERLPTPEQIKAALEVRDLSKFIRPYVG